MMFVTPLMILLGIDDLKDLPLRFNLKQLNIIRNMFISGVMFVGIALALFLWML